ncbi:blr3713 [Bradyrhizobium diazoefficiens USDA 110]|uniref:Blr3713 protein n=1 Tax=Bradyrhizobium diazoefficiens (strain JCM 10833 / BCRC 13528 / IAM 13628 / NBRC 14792 / USDA 110) TaxID=224911 RepID=Q89NX0_BRADU|nr:hypothetical protein CO678_18360 [Bradyrhizobium diazoefficiens]QBP22486.1 hypothetical protein Bdiaspc4_19160 [Bradyrhizobium diazoefficiens]QHP71311.1 hypothetical protein EI171_30980 [Bradyrhizobium sp. LCT2]BAC48978.1 blr3713 [Bradyrhizobium diazoefficiens USDA 110]
MPASLTVCSLPSSKRCSEVVALEREAHAVLLAQPLHDGLDVDEGVLEIGILAAVEERPLPVELVALISPYSTSLQTMSRRCSLASMRIRAATPFACLSSSFVFIRRITVFH